MTYEHFKNVLQEEIQANFLQHIDFMSHTVNKTNEILDALTLRFEGQNVACTIYPEQMYSACRDGVSVSDIADYVSESVSAHSASHPEMPELTAENAEKCISFSLVNIEKNKHLLQDCPYKRVYDMAAVPRWHISYEASFLVSNNLLHQLRMTKEEILDIAQRNTETAEYTCKGLDDVMREVMADEGMDEGFMDELFPMAEPPFYVITNQNCTDGSCAVLSDSFMQQTAERIGSDELYLLPASRHEMIVVNPNAVTDTSALKDLVMSVNSNPAVLRTEDFLSDSVYKYNAGTHSISVCDSNGLFHDRAVEKDSIKQTISRGRG